MEKKKGKPEKGEYEPQFFLKQISEKMPETQKSDPTKPDHSYVIDHVHGFSGDRNKNMCHFGTSNNEMIFGTAALGVVQDLKNNKQKFFGGCEKDKDAEKYQASWPFHQDDITCMDIAGGENRHIVATGECGKMSTIHVWDTKTMTSIANFSLGASAKGVAACSISPC